MTYTLAAVIDGMTPAKMKRDIERIDRQLHTFKHSKADLELHKRFLEAYRLNLDYRSSTLLTLKLKKKLDYLIPIVRRRIEIYSEEV